MIDRRTFGIALVALAVPRIAPEPLDDVCVVFKQKHLRHYQTLHCKHIDLARNFENYDLNPIYGGLEWWAPLYGPDRIHNACRLADTLGSSE